MKTEFVEKKGSILLWKRRRDHSSWEQCSDNRSDLYDGRDLCRTGYEKKGYAKEILHTLCEEIRRQGKIPCIFSPEKEQYSIFEELGFEKYGRWGIAKV